MSSALPAVRWRSRKAGARRAGVQLQQAALQQAQYRSTGLGEQLRMRQFSCEVVGVLVPKGQGGMGDQDDAVTLPLHTLQRRVTSNQGMNFRRV